MALHEVHNSLPARDHLDDGVGQVLFAVRGHPLAAAHVIHDHRAVRLDVELARHDGSRVRIDVLDRHLAGIVGVFIQPPAEPLEVGLAVEDGEPDGCLQALQHLDGLFRKAVLLVGGQVPAFVLPHRQVVDSDNDAERHEHAHRRERAVAGLAPAEVRGDVPPLAERVDHDQRQAGPRAIDRVLIPLRSDER